MKKTVYAVAMAFAMALPIATASVQADPWYTVGQKGTTLWQHSFGRGYVRCHVDPGEILHRHWGENWKRWIYVRNTVPPYTKDCRGWVDKGDLFSYVHVPHSEQWFQVRDNYVELRSQPRNSHGRIKCYVPDLAILHRDNGKRVENENWIFVRWKKLAPNRLNIPQYQGRIHCTGSNETGWILQQELVQIFPN